MVNSYTIDVLINTKNRLESLLKLAKYQDEVTFYTECLNQTLKDIDNIGKNEHISG